jgi:hypothetical protein
VQSLCSAPKFQFVKPFAVSAALHHFLWLKILSLIRGHFHRGHRRR